jgi:hypothetical protein
VGLDFTAENAELFTAERAENAETNFFKKTKDYRQREKRIKK